MRKILVVLAAILVLQGCIPAAFVAGTGAATIIYDHRTTRTILDDKDITFSVQQRLDSNEELRKQAHISVTSFNRIALLLGQASNNELRMQAETIAKSNSKVKMVYNEITVEKPISDMAKANDAWITTKVKTVLATVSGLNSSTLKVVTENRVVYLMGLTTRAQAELATEKTRTVAGVAKVVKLFEYLS